MSNAPINEVADMLAHIEYLQQKVNAVKEELHADRNKRPGADVRGTGVGGSALGLVRAVEEARRAVGSECPGPGTPAGGLAHDP